MSSAGTLSGLRRSPGLPAAVGRYVFVLCGLTLALVTALVVLRRFAGALTVPLPAGTLFLYGLGVVLLAVGARSGLRQPHEAAASHLLVSVAVVLATLAVWLPGSPAAGVVLLLLIVAAEETWTWWGNQWGRAVWPVDSPVADAVPVEATVEESQPVAKHDLAEATQEVSPKASAISDAFAEALDAAGDIFTDTAIVQQLVRRREADGQESLTGCIRAHFAPGERTTVVHIPFCPPLATLPECYAEQIDGPPARVRIAQVLHQGVRLEVRLDEPGDPTNPSAPVLVELSVQSGGSADNQP